MSRSIAARAVLLAALALPAVPPSPASAAPLARADLVVTRPTSTSVKACASGSAAGATVAAIWTLTATGSTIAQARGPLAAASVSALCLTASTSGVGAVLFTLSFAGASTAGEVIGVCLSSVTFDGGTPVIVTLCPRSALEGLAAP